MKLPSILFIILTGMVTILFAGVQLKNKSKPNPYKCALGLEDHKPFLHTSDGDLILTGDYKLGGALYENTEVTLARGTPEWAKKADSILSKWTDATKSTGRNEFTIIPSGNIRLHGDNGDNFTGTATYALAVDSLGNIIDTIPMPPTQMFNTPYMDDQGINPKGWGDGTPLILGGCCGDLQKQIDSLKIEVKKAEYILKLIDSIQKSNKQGNP